MLKKHLMKFLRQIKSVLNFINRIVFKKHSIDLKGSTQMKKLLIALLSLALLTGCSQTAQPAAADSQTAEEQSSSAVSEESSTADLEKIESSQTDKLSGHSLMVFCGAGMKKPFQEIADTFQKETGCEMIVTFANAAQIHTQINTAQEGDLFIAGSSVELKPVQEVVTETKDLVKHIPVLTVQSENPCNISGIADLAKNDVRILLGDAKSTPIGKIGDQVLSDFGIMDQVNLVARTTTAPAITTALAAGECDAAIVWKENANTDGVEIVDTKDMEKYIKTVPAASLSYSDDEEALKAFRTYLDSESAKTIWMNYGYEVMN